MGEALQAVRAQGYGDWRIVAGVLHLYGHDGSTILHPFQLDDPASPSRSIGT